MQVGAGAQLKRAVTEAHQLMSDLVAQEVEALGVTAADADVLTVIFVADYDPVPGEIAAWLGLTGAGATGRLNNLERRGLLERRRNPKDGRSVTLHLTDVGRDLATAVVEAKNTTVMTALIDRIGQAEAAALVSDLDTLSELVREVLSER